MKQKKWERLRSRILLVVVAWPWVGGLFGVVAAWYNGEHGSIIYVVLGFTVGVCGAVSDTAFTVLERNQSQIPNMHWLWVGASTLALAVLAFSLLTRPDPKVLEVAKADVVFAATYGSVPSFAISFLLSRISRVRSNPQLNRTRAKNARAG